jgi:hypothetical protein
MRAENVAGSPAGSRVQGPSGRIRNIGLAPASGPRPRAPRTPGATIRWCVRRPGATPGGSNPPTACVCSEMIGIKGIRSLADPWSQESQPRSSLWSNHTRCRRHAVLRKRSAASTSATRSEHSLLIRHGRGRCSGGGCTVFNRSRDGSGPSAAQIEAAITNTGRRHRPGHCGDLQPQPQHAAGSRAALAISRSRRVFSGGGPDGCTAVGAGGAGACPALS